MGLGSTATKIQELADAAEKLFKQLKRIRNRVTALEEDLEETSGRVERLDAEQRRQRALLEALAEEQGIDVDSVVDDVELPPELQSDDGDDSSAESDTAGESAESDGGTESGDADNTPDSGDTERTGESADAE